MITNIEDDGRVGAESLGDAVSSELNQGATNNCAVYSQFRVLREYGFKGSVDDLIDESFENGWTNEGGTAMSNVGKLLESHGVSCTQVTGANSYRLCAELAQGKQVIVAVDSGELWHGETEDGDAEPDHAITVVGLDTSDPDNPQVIVSDSAYGHIAKPYPLDEFMDAWRDSNCCMVVPDEPPPEEMGVERLANFDYDTGHIEHFGDLDFEELLELQDCIEEVEIALGDSADFSEELGDEFDEDDPFSDLESVEGFGDSTEKIDDDLPKTDDQSEFDEDDPFANLDSVEGFGDSTEEIDEDFSEADNQSEFDEDDPFADLDSINTTDDSTLLGDDISDVSNESDDESFSCEEIDSSNEFENIDDTDFSEEYN